MATNTANSLMFGSDDDSVFLAERTTSLAASLAELEFDDDIPTGLIDCGWVSEDGFALDLEDSVEKIRGHQGNAVVKEFMSSSDTTLTAALLESKLEIVKWNLDAAVSKVTGVDGDYAEIKAPSSRKVKNLVGVVDLYETSGSGSRWRLICDHLTLGQRGSLAFKSQELTTYNYSLGVLGGFRILTDTPALNPSV
jgi:hypothetical protein